jgi:asparagine synthase (glutamine-hydrolysing)
MFSPIPMRKGDYDMCGITGWVDWQRDLTKEECVVEKMAQTLGKRGPDAINVWSTFNASLGHTRLIVVDPVGGAQPMTRIKDDSTYTLVYNGELYNTDDIRKELLKRGYTFQSHSDTEVLLIAYIEWQEECINYFNGIYAFAIWDQKKRQLFIARDRLGVKPLFYSEIDGALVFGSEIKALLKHPSIKSEIDQEGLQEIFGLGPSRTPGHGIFKNLKELKPAHALKFNRSGTKIWRYWNVKSEVHRDTLNETVEKVRYLVKDAVERQLVADVPVCTFLSGGIDSSAISKIAADYFKQEGRGNLHTYSIDFDENDKYFKSNSFQPNQDGPWIKLMHEYIGSKHHSAVIDNEKLADYLEAAVLMRDLPGMADVDSSLLWFCEEIKKDFTVGLSGECADEIFGGYPWFHKKDLLDQDGFPWMRSSQEREQLLLPHWQEKLKLSSYVMERYLETVKETPRLDGESKEEARRREIFYLNREWFMQTLLDRKDRMSMGASLEVRVPFADHRIVEYVWNIPWEMKMLQGREKGLLRKAMEGLLPDDILYRKKSPYPKTHHPGYTTAVKKLLTATLEDKSAPLYEIISRDRVRDLIESDGSSFKTPWFGQLMTGPQLIAHMYQINTWLQKYNINIIV